MSKTKQALKERIKELTCLYEVSSIIANTDFELIEDTLKAIAFSLKKAFQYPDKTDILIAYNDVSIKTNSFSDDHLTIASIVKIFNTEKGKITARLNTSEFKEINFLKEEQLLLDSVALKLGNLLERIEIQKNEASLKRQMEHADRLSILGEITAGIAHELNTPLANILGFSELLKDDLESNTKAISDVDKIIKNAIFSREVVKKLMFFACEMPQEMKHVNLIEQIKNAIKLLDATFKKEQVKYVVKTDNEAIWLKADPIQLTQIVFNLLMNAIYFSPKSGKVTIETTSTKKTIVLKISDEGPGFSKENLAKVFQPFFTTKPLGDGSGLGLSVVHGIVASHKGTITAENNIKKGAIFTVTLPKD
ncbi:HAMP domain-containing histidine kinase [Winogradskyella echinorum]|uniref:histidine kinase n=1 Tax=Winogradskyella echinorum TaxID=538189 RepID=A0ABR6Y0Z7_9FLAO|nr:HAMP domain-containing sensor histidine kinase [Winogradskyella echinorum]MBC3846334.1 HAMP domain-containing histidine kinase [Winogradskyella echinorum]MBC5750682.1 HAMP domain-containing histidine kinase [Winogradskyella echinorum]